MWHRSKRFSDTRGKEHVKNTVNSLSVTPVFGQRYNGLCIRTPAYPLQRTDGGASSAPAAGGEGGAAAAVAASPAFAKGQR